MFVLFFVDTSDSWNVLLVDIPKLLTRIPSNYQLPLF